MLAMDVLSAEKHRTVDVERHTSSSTQILTSDDSVSNSDNDTTKINRISELNLNEGLNDNYPQTIFSPKMKNKSCSHEQKPYDQLSDREKQRIKEKNSRRIMKLRSEMRRYGLKRSISQLSKDDSSIDVRLRRRENSTCSVSSVDSCEDMSSSFEEEDELELERDLEHWYQSGCENYFEHDRSSWDLVAKYVDMEDQIEQLEKCLREARLQRFTRTFDAEAELEKIRVFKREIESLSKQNNVLQTENDKLRSRLHSNTR